MTVSALPLRPHTKFAAALAAAGVASAVAVTAVPQQGELPTVNVDVANASVVTDPLLALGTAVTVVDSLVGLHVDAVISLPFEASLAVLAAAQHPEVAPNVLSYLVQRFVNPAVGPPIAAYPWETEQTVALFATLLPYPLGPSATEPGLVNQGRFLFADVFDSVLGQLPDPMPGYEAVQDVSNNTLFGGAIVAGQNLARTPLYAAWTAADFLGGVPANVAANPHAPNQLPAIASGLIHAVLSPTNHAPEAVATPVPPMSVAPEAKRPAAAPTLRSTFAPRRPENRSDTTLLKVRTLLNPANASASETDSSVSKGGKHRAPSVRSGVLKRLLGGHGGEPAGDSSTSSDAGA